MGSGRPELLRAGGETLDCSPCRPGPGPPSRGQDVAPE